MNTFINHFLQQMQGLLNVDHELRSTLESITCRRSLPVARLQIAIYCLRMAQAVAVLTLSLSDHSRLLLFDYFYINHLPVEFNFVVVSVTALALYFTQVLYFKSSDSQFVTLPKQVWAHQEIGNLFPGGPFLVGKQNLNQRQILHIVKRIANLSIKSIQGFYIIFGNISLLIAIFVLISEFKL